ncbi:MAG TPA: hypothetical protein PKA64_19625 [Myxococcota bacterium]|nr:hypothetical protein [Myxococcota bacterium]
MGILLDADESAEGRWQEVRRQLGQIGVDVGGELPAAGFVSEAGRSWPRVGVWIMPDNRSRGMLETFLLMLRAGRQDGLWSFAQEVVATVRDRGASFRPTHRDKALIHAWLAWADPPGRQLHQAVMESMLDATDVSAAPFVAWFRTLYER